MTQTTPDAPVESQNPARPWQIAVAVLGLVTLTLLVINLVLVARAGDAWSAKAAATATTEQLQAENARLTARNEQLLTQLSTSNERLAEITGQLNMTKEQVAAADANVQRQVAAQEAAERALAGAQGGLPRARAQVAVLEAQLANAQTCSAGALMALAQVNAGPDIESGATEAAETLAGIMPACRSGLR